jgi:uncharacterized protein (UPF0303 family)
MKKYEEKSRFLETLLSQEERLKFDNFTYEDAWEVGNELVRLATMRTLPVAATVMLGEHRVFHVALRGSSADNNSWVDRKCRVVSRFGHSSLAVRTQYESRGKHFDVDSHLNLREYSAYGGGFPIIVGDSRVGILGISGLAHLDDHSFAVEVLDNFMNRLKGGHLCQKTAPTSEP